MLNGLFASIYGDTITMYDFLLSCALSVVLGYLISRSYRKHLKGSDSMSGALIWLPFLVQIVILLVNGNLGAGVAVAGAFSLIRFRSAPGTAQDITTIFLAMTVGLACGMGYLAIAVLAVLAVCGLNFIRTLLPASGAGEERELKITIPEDLDYTDIFDDLFQTYTSKSELTQVKTTNMGSLYSLHYLICLKHPEEEKKLLDALRCRNGNLEIVCGRVATNKNAL